MVLGDDGAVTTNHHRAGFGTVGALVAVEEKRSGWLAWVHSLHHSEAKLQCSVPKFPSATWCQGKGRRMYFIGLLVD